MFNFADKNMLLAQSNNDQRSVSYIFPFLKLQYLFLCSQLGCDLFGWALSAQILEERQTSFNHQSTVTLILIFNTININIINVITWTLGLVDSDPNAVSMMVSATLAIVDFSSAEEPWYWDLAESCSSGEFGDDAGKLFTRAGHDMFRQNY